MSGRLPDAESGPTRRADAARNRERILAAARAAFADSDAEVSMAEVARRSGVGSATLYRNFASRRELLEALYVDEVDALCAAAESVVGDDAGDRLIAWLRRFVRYFRSKRMVARDLLEAEVEPSMFNASRARVVAAGTPLLEEAQAAGQITTDLNLDQMLDLLAAVSGIAGEPAYIEPMIETTLTGLRRPGDG